jgi:hypothetical protein
MGITEKPKPQTYRVCIASHLSPDWLAMPSVVNLAIGYDSAGRPITTLHVEVVDQSQFMGVLNEMHGTNLSLLSVDLVRHSDTATGPAG